MTIVYCRKLTETTPPTYLIEDDQGEYIILDETTFINKFNLKNYNHE